MPKSKRTNMTVVINSCDAYSDVLALFFSAYKKYGQSINCQIVINTETNKYDYPANVNNFLPHNGVDQWGERLLDTLGKIPSEFVLMLYDDFILEGKILNQDLEYALNILKENSDSSVVYLIDTGNIVSGKETSEKFVLIEDRTEYRLNSAPAIWRKSDLISYTGKRDTPWAWEVFGTYRTWGNKKKFYTRNPGLSPVYPYDFSWGGAIYRGKWVREVIERVSDDLNVTLDWDIRGFVSKSQPIDREFLWKVKFLLTGFQIVGIKAAYFLIEYAKQKINAKRQ